MNEKDEEQQRQRIVDCIVWTIIFWTIFFVDYNFVGLYNYWTIILVDYIASLIKESDCETGIVNHVWKQDEGDIETFCIWKQLRKLAKFFFCAVCWI